MDAKLILGFQIDVPSDEMKTLLERAAAREREKVSEYERFIAKIGEQPKPAIEVPATLRAPFGGFVRPQPHFPVHDDGDVRASAEAQMAQHRVAADSIDFLAKHVIPDVTYRIGADSAIGSYRMLGSGMLQFLIGDALNEAALGVAS